MNVSGSLFWLLLALQCLFAARVVRRLVKTRDGQAVQTRSGVDLNGSVTIIVPTLNEQDRLTDCLNGAIKQGPEVASILIADGGSTDGTRIIADRFSALDARIRWIDAEPVPADWNGKAWGIEVGRRAAHADSPWLLTLDADAQAEPLLAASLMHHAEQHALDALSVATRQVVDGAMAGLIHPSLLTSLVYRFGIPGHVATSVTDAQANGQCMLIRRHALDSVGGLERVRDSRCEDVSLARHMVARGYRVGFAETKDDLVHVRMYSGAWNTLVGWSRSLPLRDRVIGWNFGVGLLEVTLAQALPIVLLPCSGLMNAHPAPGAVLTRLNLMLLCIRLGVLAGTRRAYVECPWTYWLSPIMDVPMSLTLWWSAFRSRQTWRGRALAEATL
jgi:dolichol-phosphate mannosyltransferase